MASSHYRSNRLVGLLYLAALAVSGCATQSPWSSQSIPLKPAQETSTHSAYPPDSSAGHAATGRGPTSPADGQHMQEVMAELQRLGTLDPAARDQLTADLQNTDPALWPGLLHQARAVAAYRHRAVGRQVAARNPEPAYAATATPTAAGRPQAAPPEGESVGPQAGVAAHESFAPRAIDRLPVPLHGALAPDGTPQQHYPRTGYPGAGLPQSNAEAPADGQSPPQLPTGEHAANAPPPSEAGFGEPQATAPASKAPAENTAAAESRNEVQSASYSSKKPVEWTEHVDSAIRLLEKASDQDPEEQVRLRMLYMATGRYDDAVRAVSDLAAGKQEFWASQFHGLGTLLDEVRNPDAPGRTAEAKQVLAEAASQLGELAPLVVRNLAFCTRVHSYGCFEAFASYEFVPEQRVLLYAEVDNFTSESTARGYHTSLKSSYQIFDARGQRVADEELALTEEICQNRRRDFFIVYDFHLPRRIYPGKHTLRLTIEDLKGKKIGDSCIDLEIVSESGSRSR